MLIIFGLILSGEGVYAVYQNHHKGQETKAGKKETSNIELVQTEEGTVQITVTSEEAITDLIYYWNSEASQTIAGNGSKSLQEVITMPVGENTLTVKTIDVNGKQTTKQGTFILNADKPTINLSLIGDKLKITVDSKTELSYITYQWNSQNAEKIEMTTYEDKTKLEKEIEIPVGQNTLVVTAVDIHNNQSEKSQEIKGVTKPVLKAPTIDGDYISFEVTADEIITQVEFSFNGSAYIIKSDVIKDSKEVKYRLKLKKGTNYLSVKATTASGITEEKFWQYNKK